jgi:hypothetical protein
MLPDIGTQLLFMVELIALARLNSKGINTLKSSVPRISQFK